MSTSAGKAQGWPLPNDQRLSMIAEDADHQPGRSRFSAWSHSSSPTQRPKTQPGKDAPPRASAETAPPEYTLWDVTGPRGEKLVDVRNNKYIARRGGWKRLLCGFLLLLCAAIGLGVGLGVGLSKRNSENAANSGSPSSSSGNATAGPFPQGFFQLPANLVNVSTSCTANSATWLCWPYQTYSESSSGSSVLFNWIISNVTGSLTPPAQLQIASSANPFALPFGNTSLTLEDAGTQNERYTFSLQLDKQVRPGTSLTNDSQLDVCFFNGTTLSAALYTKKAASASSNATAGMQDQSMGWTTWPGAVEVNHTINGGTDVPNCYELQANGNLGSAVTQGLAPQPTDDTCGCYWRNYNLA